MKAAYPAWGDVPDAVKMISWGHEDARTANPARENYCRWNKSRATPMVIPARLADKEQ
jgi:hypothetical protein